MLESGLFNYIRRNHHRFIMHHVNRCIKMHQLHIRNQANIKFLSLCRHNRIFPCFFNIKPPFVNRMTGAIVRKASLACMGQCINELHFKDKRTIKNINYHHRIINLHLKHDTYLTLLEIICRKNYNLRSYIDARQAIKFGKLMATNYPIHINEKAVHNLTNHKLSILNLSALAKVGKFALPPKSIPKLDIIIAAERCISRFNKTIQDHNAFRSLIADAINRCKPRFNLNLNPFESNYIRNLAKDDSIHITFADKGGGVVYMLWEDYDKMAMAHLDNKKIYESTKFSLNLYQQRVIEMLNWDVKYRGLNPIYVKKSSIKFPKYPNIYFLPKTHKGKDNGIYKARPIINTRNSPIQGLSNLIFKILRPYAEQLPQCVKNGLKVIEDLQNINFENKQLYSLDVQAMFTSMEYKIVKPAIYHCLNNNKEKLFLDHDMLPEHVDYLIWTMMTHQFFSYKEQQFQQIEGLFMGLAASGAISDLTMAFLEEKMFAIYPNVTYYCRYVDDTLMVCDKSLSEKIFNYLNCLHPSIKFDKEDHTNGSINFLDISILIDNFDNLHTKVYRKPTQSSRFIHYNSFTPKAHKTNTIDFMFRRAFNYCSNLNYLKVEIDECIDILLMHGYPYVLITQRIKAINTAFNKSTFASFKEENIFNLPHCNNKDNYKTAYCNTDDQTPRRSYLRSCNLIEIDGVTRDFRCVTARASGLVHEETNTISFYSKEEYSEQRSMQIIKDNHNSTSDTDVDTSYDLTSSSLYSNCSNISISSNGLFDTSTNSSFYGFTISNYNNICNGYFETEEENDFNTTIINRNINLNIMEIIDQSMINSDSGDSEETSDNEEENEVNNTQEILPPKPKVYTSFPYFPPITASLKSILSPFEITPSFISTNPLVVKKKLIDPDCIVYQIPCFDCSRPYVGQTRFKLQKRVNEHRKGFEDLDPNKSGTYRHFITEQHTPNFNAASHIQRVLRFRDRAIAEAFHIISKGAYNSATIGRNILHYFRTKHNGGGALLDLSSLT